MDLEALKAGMGNGELGGIGDLLQKVPGMEPKITADDYSSITGATDKVDFQKITGVASPITASNGSQARQMAGEIDPQDPLKLATSGLRALNTGKLKTGEVNLGQQHARMLSTGPYQEASSRQAILFGPEGPAKLMSMADQSMNNPDVASPVQLAQIGFGGGGNTSAKNQLRELDTPSLPQSSSPAVGRAQSFSNAPIMSADKQEADRLRRVAEQDAIEQKLRQSTAPKKGETEEQRLRRLHPELY